MNDQPKVGHVDDEAKRAISATEQPTSLIPTDPAAVAAAERERARIAAQCQLALMMPRNEDDARDKILRACERPKFAEDVEYEKPVGGKMMRGPSIRFIETALRLWRNIDTWSSIVYEDDEHVRVKITAMDLEANVSHSKEVRVPKTVERKSSKGRDVLSQRMNSHGDIVYIVVATNDELDNAIAAKVSKSVRNEGGRLLPADIVGEAVQKAREVLKQDVTKNADYYKRQMLDAFSGQANVRPKDIAKYVGHDLDSLTTAEIIELQGILTAINEGSTTWAAVMEQRGTGVDGPAAAITEELRKAKEGREAEAGTGKTGDGEDGGNRAGTQEPPSVQTDLELDAQLAAEQEGE